MAGPVGGAGADSVGKTSRPTFLAGDIHTTQKRDAQGQGYWQFTTTLLVETKDGSKFYVPVAYTSHEKVSEEEAKTAMFKQIIAVVAIAKEHMASDEFVFYVSNRAFKGIQSGGTDDESATMSFWVQLPMGPGGKPKQEGATLPGDKMVWCRLDTIRGEKGRLRAFSLDDLKSNYSQNQAGSQEALTFDPKKGAILLKYKDENQREQYYAGAMARALEGLGASGIMRKFAEAKVGDSQRWQAQSYEQMAKAFAGSAAAWAAPNFAGQADLAGAAARLGPLPVPVNPGAGPPVQPPLQPPPPPNPHIGRVPPPL